MIIYFHPFFFIMYIYIFYIIFLFNIHPYHLFSKTTDGIFPFRSSTYSTKFEMWIICNVIGNMDTLCVCVQILNYTDIWVILFEWYSQISLLVVRQHIFMYNTNNTDYNGIFRNIIESLKIPTLIHDYKQVMDFL